MDDKLRMAAKETTAQMKRQYENIMLELQVPNLVGAGCPFNNLRDYLVESNSFQHRLTERISLAEQALKGLRSKQEQNA